MIKKIDFNIDEFNSLKNYPKEIFHIGDLNLLKKRKISIVGTRRPNLYTKELTHKISSKFASNNFVIVSGAAMGVDTIAHKASNFNTIAIMANGLDIRYPSINSKFIKQLEENSLVLSTYKEKQKARVYTFVQRNELVVALGEFLIVTQADLDSGSLHSVDYALSMGKKVYTLSHRIGESLGTQKYIEKGLIEPIYDLDVFFSKYIKNNTHSIKDEFICYCQKNPSYEEALDKWEDKLLEAEVLGLISVKNGKIFVK